MNTIPQNDTPRNKPFTLTPEQREEICKRYVAGESTVELAKAYGVTKAAIRHLLITRDIPRRENTPELHRTYTCNHAYFDQPLDEERAYWIGFLLADGFVSYRKPGKTGAPTIGMSLAEIDIAHVERFRNALQSQHPIARYVAKSGYGAGGSMARFAISSGDLVRGVEQYGIVPNKTSICATPNIPKDLMRHMYRGYVDGDGGLSLYKAGQSMQACLDIVGTESFLRDMALWLKTAGVANPQNLTKSKHTTAVMFLKYCGIHQVSNILHLLYDNATVALDRKVVTAQSIWEAERQSARYCAPSPHALMQGTLF